MDFLKDKKFHMSNNEFRHRIKLGKLGRGTNIHLDVNYLKQKEQSLTEQIMISHSRSTKTEQALQELRKLGIQNPTDIEIKSYFENKYKKGHEI